MGLSRLGYIHEYVDYSDGEWIKDKCHVNNYENRVSIHREICKDNVSLYLTAFKTCRRSRNINPIKVVMEILEIICILATTKSY